MADARALLRAERASRRITHPHASYTGDGKLHCNLCETLVKSEAHWQSHLHSTQHNLRSQRQQDVAATRGTGGDGGSKKRKAESIESPPQERKKARAQPVREEIQQEDEVEAVVEEQPTTETAPEPSKPNGTPGARLNKPTSNDINADDILAFERELDALEATAAREEEAERQASIRNAATISAAPMTAEELAAQAREEQSAQRGKRDQELEEEREDAARVLEEEMEEMEGLEERVRALRERRERLRGKGEGSGEGITANGVGAEDGGGGLNEVGSAIEHGVDEGEESSDDDDVDEWKFGGS